MAVSLPKHRFSIEDFHRMGEVGLLSEDDRVELIDGEIVEMAAIGSGHAACIGRLTRLFSQSVGDRAIVWVQNPLRLHDLSQLVPDVTLLTPRDDFYDKSLPGPADAFLVVEVADTTLTYDRGVKVPRYATAGVPEVWIVDLDHAVVDVFREPRSTGYADVSRRGQSETVQGVALPLVEFTVADLIGGR